MTSVKVSYLVAVKNMHKTIRKCIRSILTQKPFEIIVVNGHSIDGTSDIIDKMRMKEPSLIKHIYDSGIGPASARNIGLLFATGNYIVIIDGDESLNRGFQRELLATIMEHDNPEIIIHNTVFITSRNNIWSRLYRDERIIFTNIREIFLKKLHPIHRFRIYNRKFLTQLKGWDDTICGGQEDVDLSKRALKYAVKIISNKRLKILKDERDISPQTELDRGIFYGKGLPEYIRKNRDFIELTTLFPISFLADFFFLPIFYICIYQGKIRNLLGIIAIRVIRSLGYSIGFLKTLGRRIMRD